MFSFFYSYDDLFQEKWEPNRIATDTKAVLYINDSCYKYGKSKQVRT